MLEYDSAELISGLTARPSRSVLALRGAPSDQAAVAALRHAADAVRTIGHPDQPDEPLPNRVDALLTDDGPTLHLDLQDHSDAAAQVVEAIVAALRGSGVDGRLESLRPPPPPYEYDANADILTGAITMDTPDGRGLPPAFPDHFPIPADGELVIVQRARADTWQHAAWRGTRPFDDVPGTLRAFGCALDLVTARDRLTDATRMTRWLLRHPQGTGSVSLYHEYDPRTAPRLFYVSVVWRPA